MVAFLQQPVVFSSLQCCWMLLLFVDEVILLLIVVGIMNDCTLDGNNIRHSETFDSLKT